MSQTGAAGAWERPAASRLVRYPPLTRALLSLRTLKSRAWITVTLSLLIVASGSGITLALGVPHTTIYGHDIFGLLDGAWRVLDGQIPHVDFYSAFGPVFYLLWAAGLRIAHERIEGIVYATALAGLVLGLWSLAIFRERLRSVFVILGVAFLTCFWLAPFPLGEPHYLTGYAMQYNRLGYVLLAIVAVELFGAPPRSAPRLADWGGLSSGVALGLLLFLKANFFVAGLVLCAFAWLFRIKSPRHALNAAAGFLCVACGIALYLHGNLAAFFHDLSTAASARQNRFSPTRDLSRILLRNLTAILTLCGLAALARALPDTKANHAPCLRHPILLPLLILAADLVLAASNQQRSGFPLSVVAVLLFACQIAASAQSPWRATAAWATLIAAIAIFPFFGDTVNAWAAEISMRQNTVTGQALRVDVPRLASLVFVDHVDPVWDQSDANGRPLTRRVNEGIALLRQYSAPGERIACLCQVNPFPYALGRRPILGGSPFFDYGFNFTERFGPSAERILGGAGLVIYRKSEITWTTVSTLLRICRPLLERDYHPLAESSEWVLLKRN